MNDFEIDFNTFVNNISYKTGPFPVTRVQFCGCNDHFQHLQYHSLGCGAGLLVLTKSAKATEKHT